MTLAVSPTVGQSIKLDSMAEINITTTSTTNNVNVVTYVLFKNGNTLATHINQKNNYTSPTAVRTASVEPAMTWVDTATSTSETYTVAVTVTGTNQASANTTTRALNAIIF